MVRYPHKVGLDPRARPAHGRRATPLGFADQHGSQMTPQGLPEALRLEERAGGRAPQQPYRSSAGQPGVRSGGVGECSFITGGASGRVPARCRDARFMRMDSEGPGWSLLLYRSAAAMFADLARCSGPMVRSHGPAVARVVVPVGSGRRPRQGPVHSLSDRGSLARGRRTAAVPCIAGIARAGPAGSPLALCLALLRHPSVLGGGTRSARGFTPAASPQVAVTSFPAGRNQGTAGQSTNSGHLALAGLSDEAPWLVLQTLPGARRATPRGGQITDGIRSGRDRDGVSSVADLDRRSCGAGRGRDRRDRS